MSSAKMIMRRFGGSSQLRIESFKDLLLLEELPEAHWAVLSCPVKGLDCEQRLLDLLDTDNDGRINGKELKESVVWCAQRVKDIDIFDKKNGEIALDDFSDSAKNLKDAARLVLDNLGCKDSMVLKMEQIQNRSAIMKNAGTNGDGFITPASVSSDLNQAVSDILSCVEAQQDRSGDAAINKNSIDEFIKLRDASIAHFSSAADVMHWADNTPDICTAIDSISEAVDDWFALAELASFNPQLAQSFEGHAINVSHPRDRSAIDLAHAAQGIAPISSGDLQWQDIHPHSTGKILRSLRERCFDANDQALSHEQWLTLLNHAQSYKQWCDLRDQNPASALGQTRLQELTQSILDKLITACDNDLALADEIKAIDDLDRLLLCQEWLLPLCNNFVSLPYLFDHKKRAMFERGTLIMAGREYHLAVHVENRKHHITIANESGLCIVYVKISGGDPRQEYEVAVPITAGMQDSLFVGRRGIFVDIRKKYFEAEIVHVISNPVSMREAIIQPFLRIGKFFSSKIDKWSQSVDSKFEKNVDDVVSEKKPTPVATGQASNISSNLMGGSIAFAALGSSMAFITSKLSEIKPLNILFGLGVLVLLILIPTCIIAAIKLRKRNLSALLQASLWAINDRMLLNQSLGRLLSCRPTLPSNAVSESFDNLKSILKDCDIEDDRIPAFRVFTLLAALAAVCCSATSLFCLSTDVLTWHICAIVSALIACAFGLRAWKRLSFIPLALLVALAASIYNLSRYLL
ncbi:MAG: hypothetical protein HRU15_01620 [Planctomycetes bacterium]|nr:hypothetical protein [Planctomycetota bacterium]